MTHPLARQHYNKEDRRTWVMRITHAAGALLLAGIFLTMCSMANGA